MKREEEIWYETGCIEGLKAADAEPNLESLWHNAKEEPNGDNWEIICVDDLDSFWAESKANFLRFHNNWDEYTAVFCVKMWAYTNSLKIQKSERRT